MWGLKTNFYELKKELTKKKVADTNQFIDNIIFNHKVLEYCKEVILTSTKEYDRRVKEYHEEIYNDLQKNKIASITYLDDSIEILGVKTSIPFLISKNIKDIIQYANNILDSLAQVVNCALINPQYPKDKVDFGFLYNSNRDKLSNFPACVNIKKVFKEISENDEFSFLRKSNNRIKHIMDIPINIGFKLFEDEGIKLIKGFTKNDITFSENNINDKCNNICKFISESIDSVCNALRQDIIMINHEFRFNSVNIYGQIGRYNNEKIDYKDADFIIAYLEISETDVSKIPNQVGLIFAEVINDERIEIFNYDYDLLLIKIGGLYEGYAKVVEDVDSDFLSYRKYNIHLDNQSTFHDIMLNKTKMKIYPFASEQHIVIYDKEKDE